MKIYALVLSALLCISSMASANSSMWQASCTTYHGYSQWFGPNRDNMEQAEADAQHHSEVFAHDTVVLSL